jgi:hypothetical protein
MLSDDLARGEEIVFSNDLGVGDREGPTRRSSTTVAVAIVAEFDLLLRP